jgi:NitT/TauT family transport system ATP-binding protein
LIAGFESPTSGVLQVNQQAVHAPGPDRGVVFQEAALFPWLTVWENVIFGPKVQGLPKAEYEDARQRNAQHCGLARL